MHWWPSINAILVFHSSYSPINYFWICFSVCTQTTFITVFEIIIVNPVDKSINVLTDKAITITLSGHVTAGSDYNDINLHIRIQYEKCYYYYWSNTLIIPPNNGWYAGTTYTVNIPVNAVNGLWNAYSFIFTPANPTINTTNPTNNTVKCSHQPKHNHNLHWSDNCRSHLHRHHTPQRDKPA